MTKTETITELGRLIASRNMLINRIKRKTSMRPSEKAMSLSAYVREIEALKTAQAVCEHATEANFA